jgi:hypothetical protein
VTITGNSNVASGNTFANSHDALVIGGDFNDVVGNDLSWASATQNIAVVGSGNFVHGNEATSGDILLLAATTNNRIVANVADEITFSDAASDVVEGNTVGTALYVKQSSGSALTNNSANNMWATDADYDIVADNVMTVRNLYVKRTSNSTVARNVLHGDISASSDVDVQFVDSCLETMSQSCTALVRWCRATTRTF